MLSDAYLINATFCCVSLAVPLLSFAPVVCAIQQHQPDTHGYMNHSSYEYFVLRQYWNMESNNNNKSAEINAENIYEIRAFF